MRHLLLLVLLLPTPGLAADAALRGVAGPAIAHRIAEDAVRLRALIDLDAATEQQRTSLERPLAALDEIETELSAGRAYLALLRLDRVRETLESYAYYVSKSDVHAAGIEAFEAEWRDADRAMQEKAALYRAANPARVPAAVRALAEASWRQAVPYYRTSRTHAKAAGNGAGFYYLATGRSQLDAALFYLDLGFDEAVAAPAVPPLADAVARLEAETGEAYKEGAAAIEHHSRFIALNSALKEARELEEDELRFGAFFKVLDARRRLEEIRRAGDAAPRAADLRQLAEAWRSRLDGSAADTSLARLFWEMAQASLEGDGEDGAERQDELRRAEAVLLYVLPQYFNLIEKGDA